MKGTISSIVAVDQDNLYLTFAPAERENVHQMSFNVYAEGVGITFFLTELQLLHVAQKCDHYLHDLHQQRIDLYNATGLTAGGLDTSKS